MNKFQMTGALVTGFVAGVLFLISCSDSSSGAGPVINSATANLPDITDQMYCVTTNSDLIVDQNQTNKILECISQSALTKFDYHNLAEVLSEGWIMIHFSTVVASSASTATSYIFYK